MHRPAIFTGVTLLIGACLLAAPKGGLLAQTPTTRPDPRGFADALAREFVEPLAKARYLEAGPGVEVSVPKWQGFPTRRHTYSVTDKDGRRKSADVILLDPSAQQIARWIVSALIEVEGKYQPDRGRALFTHIIGQSGGQFPVAGVVYEDILPADGVNEIFCFRDGVTVAVEGVPHRGTEPLTPDQIQQSIAGEVKRVYTFGRIASTSPQQWIASGGDAGVLDSDGKPTCMWLDKVRAAYQDAWRSDRNALLVAWLRGQGPR